MVVSKHMEIPVEKNIFNLLGCLLEYPENNFYHYLKKCEELINLYNPSTVFGFKKFKLFVKRITKEELQELYIKTFELNSVCIPYVGVHIFGEDGFKRGAFLSRLKNTYNDYKINARYELPDHISKILKLACYLEDTRKFNDLLSECIINPITLMIAQFKNDTNPYKHLLICIRKIAELSSIEEVKYA